MPWKLTSVMLTAPAFKCDLSSWLLTYIIDLHISPVWLHKIPLGSTDAVDYLSLPLNAKVTQATTFSV